MFSRLDIRKPIGLQTHQFDDSSLYNLARIQKVFRRDAKIPERIAAYQKTDPFPGEIVHL